MLVGKYSMRYLNCRIYCPSAPFFQLRHFKKLFSNKMVNIVHSFLPIGKSPSLLLLPSISLAFKFIPSLEAVLIVLLLLLHFYYLCYSTHPFLFYYLPCELSLTSDSFPDTLYFITCLRNFSGICFSAQLLLCDFACLFA